MKVEIPKCPYCNQRTGLSTMHGFFKCVNIDCIKNGQYVVEDYKTFEMVYDQWSDSSGRVHHRKGKRYGRR